MKNERQNENGNEQILKKAGMKFFTFAAAIMLMFGAAVFTGCESNQDKVADAKEDVQEAKEDLAEVKREVREDAQERASDEEWRVFKDDAEVKIRDNETRIKQIKEERKSSGNSANVQYSNDIEALEKRNRDLQTRIDTYDRDNGNWESFKREFNHDMESFGQAFKNLVQDNKQ